MNRAKFSSGALHRVPARLVGGLAALPELLRASAKWRGLEQAEIEEIIRLVPEAILERVCFLDKVTSLWRYEYGEPFDGIPDNFAILGTNIFHEVDRLFDVIICARSRLDRAHLSEYLHRLANPNKHQDYLFEFAPILRLDLSIQVEYEVADFSDGDRTVDWLIKSERVPILLDVKNRIKDLIEALSRFQLGERETDGTAPSPIHNPSLLFRSAERKFLRRSPSELVQALWITTALKQEESELIAAFSRLDPMRVHAAILGDWEDDVYILTNDASAKEILLDVLRLRESRRAIFQRGALPD